MVRLSWCWIVVESIVIPNGFMKWFYLSFYIHPSFLALLQIFLWITKLYTSLLFLLAFVSKISTFVITKTLSFCNNQSPTIITPNHLTTTTHGFKTSLSVANISAVKIYQEEEEEEEVCHVVLSSCSSNSSPDSGYASGIWNDQFLASSCSEEEDEEEEEDDDDDHVFISSCGSNSPDMGMSTTDHQFLASPAFSSSGADEFEYDEMMAAAGVCNSINLPPAMGDDEETNIDEYNAGEDDIDDDDDQLYQEVTDPFYNAYLQKMKWFDVLNHDRFFATKAMKNQKHIAARRVGKSLEHDLELVYVAQSCLSWEALHHHFTKVEAATSSNSHMLLFHNSVAESFQKFRIVLERFLEDERCGAGGTTRHSNYVHSKYSLQTLLLVPQLSGYHNNGKMLSEGIKAIEVLKAIEKCITTFWLYVKMDTKKLGWSRPTLEDPRDLDLLHALTKLLRKKEASLKRVEGKRRCWLRRRAVHMQEENTELICTKIEMKLIGRVLKLPIISTSHLQWCQHKLSNLEFNKDGSIIRAYTGFLFPS